VLAEGTGSTKAVQWEERDLFKEQKGGQGGRARGARGTEVSRDQIL